MLANIEREAWDSFAAIVHGFLGNHKDENYVSQVRNLIENYERMGCRMSLKVHVLDAHLQKFKENLGDFSEEHGECFHQDVLLLERRYKGAYNENMMGDFVRSLVLDCEFQHRRKFRKTTYF